MSDELRVKLLRAETDALLRSPDFIRSPVMSQLLSYLVGEAISNPGNPPKAYQVAVDGLGRTEDFDVQADSYPRVQVGRLRKMLAAHYAAHGGATRLHIPIGHYAVEVEAHDSKLEDRPSGTGTHATATPAATDSAPWFKQPGPLVALAALLLMIAIGLIWWFNTANPQPAEDVVVVDNYTLPPKIYIATDQSQPSAPSSASAGSLELFFEDAFASSSQVRLVAADGANLDPEDSQHGYLFNIQLVTGPSGPVISFSLTSLLKNEKIWSTMIALPESVSEYPEKLGPIASRVAGVYGVIPTDQRKRLPDDAVIGYACLLRFESYRANRDPQLLPAVDSCIEKSLLADPLDSSILAAASFLSFLRKEATGQQPDPEAGMEYARNAMIRGREDASANFALARASFFNGNCSRGKEFAEKAAELAPYEATIQAETGAYLFGCDNPGAIKYLRRAMRLDPRGSILAETALALTLLAEGKDAEALEFAEKIVPSSTVVGPYYEMTMAMVYAKNGQISKSRAAWDRLVAAYGDDSDESHDQMLRRIITNPLLANRAIDLLKSKGVIKE
ncbi:MAG: hypothetical protein COA41_04730 [Sphingopyxis sp.]|nr:MAG: hypothetical protein COA41_04730 [Sphingopyxis sp.]